MIKTKHHGFYWLMGCLSLTGLASCNEADSFGSDLLQDDWLHALGVDSFNFTAGPAAYDSIVSYDDFTTMGLSGFQDVSFPLGKMTDPLFGVVEAGFGTQLRIIPSKNLDFLQRPVDSVVLSLRYDTALFYGKYHEPMSIGVYPLTDPYDVKQVYYSNHKIAYDQMIKLGGLIDFIPNKRDSVTLQEDTLQIKRFPQLRIPMDTGVFMATLRHYADTVFFTQDSFSKVYPGIALVCEKGNGILSVLPEHSESRVTIYYKDTADNQAKRELLMSSLAAKTPFYKMDPQGTTAEACINGSISGDSLLALQGFEGRDIRLQLPYDSSWSKKLINFAVLHFYVDERPGDDLTSYPPPQLLELFDLSSGSRVAIDDVRLGITSRTSYTRIFGGYPIKTEVNGKTVYLYKMNITRHFQKSLRAKKDMDLVVSPLLKLESPARAFLKGRKTSDLRARLVLSYSE